jgi:hypothetical protein
MAFPIYKKHSGEMLKGIMTVIGKSGLMQSDKMQFNVIIRDVKQAFGRVDYLVTPVSGDGETWVSSERVAVN